MHDTVNQELSRPLKDVLLPAALIEGVVKRIGLLLGPCLPEYLLRLGRTHIGQHHYLLIYDLRALLRLLQLFLGAKWAAANGHQDVRIPFLHVNNIVICPLIVSVGLSYLCGQLGIVRFLLQRGVRHEVRVCTVIVASSRELPLARCSHPGHSLVHNLIPSHLDCPGYQVVDLLLRGILVQAGQVYRAKYGDSLPP